MRGLEIVEGYFPGLTAALVAQGADYGDVSQNARWFHEGDHHRPAVSGHNAINVSRPLLEATVRARLLELPNVRLVDDCDVLGLLTTPDAARVSGVRLLRRRADSAEFIACYGLIFWRTMRASAPPRLGRRAAGTRSARRYDRRNQPDG